MMDISGGDKPLNGAGDPGEKAQRGLSALLFPQVSRSVRRELDKENLGHLLLLSSVALVLEVVMLLLFLSQKTQLPAPSRAGIISICICILLCASGMIVSIRLRSKELYGGWHVTALSVFFFLLLIGWGIAVSARHYTNNEQLLTFFAILLCMISFLTFHPLFSALLSAAAYAGLYIVLWYIDGAAGINIYNFIFLAALTALVMAARYHRHLRRTRLTMRLRQHNERLTHVSRHDPLTGARNRVALEEDANRLLLTPLTVIMSDIDGLKRINDSYGHAVGDRAISEAKRYLEKLFPEAVIYRFGGDEFLLLLQDADPGHIQRRCNQPWEYQLSVRGTVLPIRISFGMTNGIAVNQEEVNDLILKADQKLFAARQTAFGLEQDENENGVL